MDETEEYVYTSWTKGVKNFIEGKPSLLTKVLDWIRNRFRRKPERMPQPYRDINLWEVETKPLGTAFGRAYIIDDEEEYLGRS
ncbi:MAG: hypothetical protein NWE89_05250 [Candidatus Bathyarchaeota archaeon]|nr:hypothetical protein [Candidatus Bathyarchaeota archaeon]